MDNYEDYTFDEVDIEEGLLYHYTSMEKAFEYILKNMNLRFSEFKNVNDPKERKQKDIGFSFVSTDLYENIGHYKAIMNDILLNKSKLICFSEDNIDKRIKNEGKLYHRGFFKLRMWSQYGENHKGVCLLFDKEKLNSEFENIKYGNKYSGAVKYSNSINGYVQAFTIERLPESKRDFKQYF